MGSEPCSWIRTVRCRFAAGLWNIQGLEASGIMTERTEEIMGGVFFIGSSTAPDLTSTFTTAVNGAQTQVMAYIGIALGAALGIVIAIFAIKKAVGFFKSMANKG